MCPKSFGRQAGRYAPAGITGYFLLQDVCFGLNQASTCRQTAGKRLQALRAAALLQDGSFDNKFSPTLCVCMYGDGEHTICGQIFYLISQTKTKLKQKRLQFLFCSLLYLVCKLNARGYPPKRFLPDNQFSDRAGARLPAGAYLLVRNFYIKDALCTCLN